MLYSFATLEQDKLKAIQALEKEIGTPVVALESIDAAAVKLGNERLKKLRNLEQELGVVLVAVKPQ